MFCRKRLQKGHYNSLPNQPESHRNHTRVECYKLSSVRKLSAGGYDSNIEMQKSLVDCLTSITIIIHTTYKNSDIFHQYHPNSWNNEHKIEDSLSNCKNNETSAYRRYLVIWKWVLLIGWLITVMPADIGSASRGKLARYSMLFITFMYATIATYPVLSNQTCQKQRPRPVCCIHMPKRLHLQSQQLLFLPTAGCCF